LPVIVAALDSSTFFASAAGLGAADLLLSPLHAATVASSAAHAIALNV
jgi:hypothetical protein